MDDLTLDQIYRCAQAIARAGDQLPRAELIPAERRALGGTFFREAPWVVARVARALTRAPELFPERPISGPDLQAMQESADAWLLLRCLLEDLLQRVTDCHLKVQGEAIRLAMGVARQVEGEVRLKGVGPRARALLPVLMLLLKPKLKKTREKKGRGAGERAQAALQAAYREWMREGGRQ